ncbi:hypothetical protein CHARACLAT_012958, partial [Characodon lateralis]|nr:hypothetical protein [Characodon lateralis]
DTLEGPCLSAGLGTPWAPPGGAGRGVWGEGRLGVSAESAAPATPSRMKRKTTSTSNMNHMVIPYFSTISSQRKCNLLQQCECLTDPEDSPVKYHHLRVLIPYFFASRYY